MKEPVEDKLIQKIRQVFDEYEDDSAESGWSELRKAYPEQQDGKPIFIWFSSAAAILLILSGFWFFTSNERKYSHNKAKLNNAPAPLTLLNKSVKNSVLVAVSRKNHPQKKSVRSVTGIAHSDHSQKTSAPRNELKQVEVESSISYQLLTDSIYEQRAAVQMEKQIILEEDVPHPAEKVLITNYRAQKTFNTMAGNEPKKEVKKDKKLMLSVYAGTYMNYAKGSESRFNLGAGLTSDIVLAKNFKFSTGFSIAKSSLEFSNAQRIPESASRMFTDKTTLSNSLTTGFSSYQISNLNADFLVLDLPINIKYQLASQKNNLYILTGLSSGTYINEAYTYTYQEKTFINNKSSADKKSKNAVESFGNFDFAKTLNISMGLSTNLSKTQNFTIEPFFKYPLGGLGSQDISFGSAGINLKLNFKPHRK